MKAIGHDIENIIKSEKTDVIDSFKEFEYDKSKVIQWGKESVINATETTRNWYKNHLLMQYLRTKLESVHLPDYGKSLKFLRLLLFLVW